MGVCMWHYNLVGQKPQFINTCRGIRIQRKKVLPLFHNISLFSKLLYCGREGVICLLVLVIYWNHACWPSISPCTKKILYPHVFVLVSWSYGQWSKITTLRSLGLQIATKTLTSGNFSKHWPIILKCFKDSASKQGMVWNIPSI
jgi:hypothetical protein